MVCTLPRHVRLYIVLPWPALKTKKKVTNKTTATTTTTPQQKKGHPSQNCCLCFPFYYFKNTVLSEAGGKKAKSFRGWEEGGILFVFLFVFCLLPLRRAPPVGRDAKNVRGLVEERGRRRGRRRGGRGRTGAARDSQSYAKKDMRGLSKAKRSNDDCGDACVRGGGSWLVLLLAHPL